jgi:hypothetical protein
LDARVTEPLLYEIFATAGAVEQVKIIKDRAVRKHRLYNKKEKKEK